MYGTYYGSSDEAMLMVLLIFYFVFLAILGGIGILGYILKSIGLYRMGQRKDIPYAWLAWIPVASNFLFGKLAGDISFEKRQIKNTGVWMLLFPLIVTALTYIFVIFLVAMIISAGVIMVNYYEPSFSIGVIFLFYFVFLGFISAISIVKSIFYGLVYWKYFSNVKPNATSLLYTMLALFVPLALQINVFRVRDLPLNDQQSVQSEINPTL